MGDNNTSRPKQGECRRSQRWEARACAGPDPSSERADFAARFVRPKVGPALLGIRKGGADVHACSAGCYKGKKTSRADSAGRTSKPALLEFYENDSRSAAGLARDRVRPVRAGFWVMPTTVGRACCDTRSHVMSGFR